VRLLAPALVVGVAASSLLAADAWTLWKGTTTFTDINTVLPAEEQIELAKGLDRATCEIMKQNKLAELRQPSSAVPGSFWEDGFLRLPAGSERTATKVLTRYLCVRADARPGIAPWYYPGWK
jgi:hypothetical protein